MGVGTGFHEVLAKQLGDMQRRLTQEFQQTVQKLEADNLALRSENETLRAKLNNGTRPGTPYNAPAMLPMLPLEPESVFVASSDKDPSADSTVWPGYLQLGEEEGNGNGRANGRPSPLVTIKDVSEPAEPSAWPIWRRLNEDRAETPAKACEKKESLSTRASERSVVFLTDGRGGASCTLHPNSMLVIGWTLIGITLLGYDAVLIPMTSGFPLDDVSLIKVMDKIIVSYWVVDLVRTFFTGYENGSIAGVEMGRWKIAQHYGKTWLALDSSIIIVDVVLTFSAPDDGVWMVSDGGPSRAGKAARVWRIMRVIRILRVLKMARKLWRKTENTVSIHYILAVKALYVFIADLFVCHYMACYFCALGTTLDGGTSWKTVQRLDESLGIEQIYPVALNWALAQSGFSTSSVQATTEFENLYTCLCGFLWMVVVCVTIGLFYTWMIEARELMRNKVEEGNNLRKYLEQREVSRVLAVQILRYFRFNYRPYEHRVLEAEVSFLRDLPRIFQIRLHKEVYINVLRQHPFFSALGTENEAALIAICQLAITEYRYKMGDTAFQSDVEARGMLCVISGELTYHPRKAGLDSIRVQAGDWLCEAALWRRWRHRGQLDALTPAELMGVDTQKVHEILEDRIDGEGWDSLTMVRKHARKALTYYGANGTDPGNRMDTDNMMKGGGSKVPTSPSKNSIEVASPSGNSSTVCWDDPHSSPAVIRSTFQEIRSLTHRK